MVTASAGFYLAALAAAYSAASPPVKVLSYGPPALAGGEVVGFF